MAPLAAPMTSAAASTAALRLNICVSTQRDPLITRKVAITSLRNAFVTVPTRAVAFAGALPAVPTVAKVEAPVRRGLPFPSSSEAA